MYFGLPQVEFCIISLTDCPGQVKNSGLGFKCQAHAGAEISIIQLLPAAGIPAPAAICQYKEKRILPHQIPVFHGGHGILRQVLALLIKTPQQFIAPDLEQFIAENISALKKAPV